MSSLTYFHETVQELSARLPELEWKLSALGTRLHSKTLPRGLFKYNDNMTVQSYIDEIKSDLNGLKKQDNARAAYYLASQISQKINTLVKVCQLSKGKETVKRQATFSVQKISTRQQWLETLHQDIATLTGQRNALALRLTTLRVNDTQVMLGLQSELGILEQQLTLANETLNRASQCH